MRYTAAEAVEMARRAIIASGANAEVAESLARATVEAELSGRSSVGFSHLPDYLDGFAKGRIAGKAQPEISFPAPAIIQADAKRGIAQLGFDLAFDELRHRATMYGIAAFSQRNCFTTGELGYYTRRLAASGLLALAASNGPPLMTTVGNREAVYGTNPFSFAVPTAEGSPLLIDQASSASAFVNIRQAAEAGTPIPESWAVDAEGNPTISAAAAMKGALLAFGGSRGANIALMVEVLAAGLTGANWSLDAPPFDQGQESPAIGLFMIALKPDLLVADFSSRLASQLGRLSAMGVHLPGQRSLKDDIELPDSLVSMIQAWSGPATAAPSGPFPPDP